MTFFYSSTLVNPTLFIFFYTTYFIVFPAIWTLSLTFIDLIVVAAIAYLVLAVAWVEVLLLLLKSCLAHIANVLPFPNNHGLLFLRTVLQRFFVRVLPKLLPV